jgi:intracellular sulfur oxidation DsrE/DsrF family protein
MRNNDELEISAYVDGELTPEERIEFLTAMRADPELLREACELNNLKSQLQLAYANPPGLAGTGRTGKRSPWAALAAGTAMLAAGLFGGWVLGTTPHNGDRFVMLDAEGRGQAPATAQSPETRIVVHLTNPDQAVAGELLDDVEHMLRAYQQDGQPLRVEIVSHGEGLDLLRSRLSEHRERISALSRTFENLTFVACKNTIDRVQVSQGIEVNMIPEAEVTESGVNHVVKRQKEGWTYIRV